MQWDLGVRKLSAMESSATNLSSLRFAEEWRLWKRTHRKSYASSNEELERYAIWQSNTAYIENHNKHWDKFGYTLGMNQFGDLVRDYIMSKAIAMQWQCICMRHGSMLYTKSGVSESDVSELSFMPRFCYYANSVLLLLCLDVRGVYIVL